MGQRTPLYDLHLALGAKIVDDDGWDMPLHYGSQVEEHHQVRRDCGVFDVSHMSIVDVHGVQARGYLRRVLANDVARLDAPGRALYSAVLNERGGILDDVIVYLTGFGYRLVANAARRECLLDWLNQHAQGLAVELIERRDLAMLAIQGPQARERTIELLNAAQAGLIRELRRFQGAFEGDWFIARTGYTGEDGLEIILPAADAIDFLNELIGAGIAPAGLGARDTLRLEAGLNRYGQEMDESVTPLQTNMAWTVAWEPDQRIFIGRDALQRQLIAGVQDKLVGVVLDERGVLRAGQPLKVDGIGEGLITSGSFSPTLGKAIGLARVPITTADRADVEIRGRWYPVRVVSPQFVRDGKILV